VLYKFIWNKRYLAAKAPERISRITANKPVKLGGLGMLDIKELDESLKLRALGRLMSTNHPFLRIIRDNVNLEDYLFPECRTYVDPPTKIAADCLMKDRIQLLSDQNLLSNRMLVGLLKDCLIKNIVNALGKNSLHYLTIRLAGKRKIGDLSEVDLNRLTPFIDRKYLNSIQTILPLNGRIVTREDKEIIFVRGKPKLLGKMTSKEIRLNRSDLTPICVFKTGTILNPNESLTYFYKLSKLVNVRHRDLLLRIHHGDIYSKERLCRFALTDDPICPRCDEIETIEHKFATCTYVTRIWTTVMTRLNRTVPTNIQETLVPDSDSQLNLLLHAEILLRINRISPDQPFLLRPNIFVDLAIKYLIKMEKSSVVKQELEALL